LATPKSVFTFTPYETSLWNLSWYGGRQEQVKFLTRLHDPKKTVYVAIGNSEQARFGTIAIAVPKGYDKDRSTWPVAPIFNDSNSYNHFGDVTLYFDDSRVSKANIFDQHLYELPDYTGDTVWKFVKKEKKPDVEVFDRMGHSIKIGDFITFVVTGYYKASTELKFGFIEAITPRGVITVKSIKLDDTDHATSHRIPQADNKICKINKEIVDELMLRRLTF
jgi:hypothetical protein